MWKNPLAQGYRDFFTASQSNMSLLLAQTP